MGCRSRRRPDRRTQQDTTMNLIKTIARCLSVWAWREQLRLYENVAEDAQSLIDALFRGEPAGSYCGYGRDLQASNYRDELKWSLHELNKTQQ